MNQLIISSEPMVMSSLDFLHQIINPAREQAGENPVANSKFKKRVMDELELDQSVGHFVQPPTGGTPQLVFYLNQDQMMLVGMRESKHVRKIVLEKLKHLSENNQPRWLRKLSPEVKAILNDLNNQLEAAEGEVDRLQGVCQTITAQFAEGMTACKFATQLNGVNIQKINRYLVGRGVLHKDKHGHSPTAYYRDRYFRAVISNFRNDRYNRIDYHTKPELTLKGARWLYKLYLNNELPMKKDWDGKHTHALIPEETQLSVTR